MRRRRAPARALYGLAMLLLVQAVLQVWAMGMDAPPATPLTILQSVLWVSIFSLLGWFAWRILPLSGATVPAPDDARIRQRLEQASRKAHTYEVLYDIATSINMASDLDDLLNRFLHTMKDVVSARAACVRLQDDQGHMQLVASIGLDEVRSGIAPSLPLDECLVGTVLCDDSERWQRPELRDIRTASGKAGDPSDPIVVPLVYRDSILGIYTLHGPRADLISDADNRELLISIGRHLGMAIEKSQLDEEARDMTIRQERTTLAHELHDSLAQTLASLRFQVRVLDSTLQGISEYAAISAIEKVENSLDEAYSELRELIAHFRAPIGGQGLIQAVEHLVDRVRAQCTIPIFLQYHDWGDQALSPGVEVNILRIIQESLNNIRKHSQASNVRVMLRQEKDHARMILIEDDGIGIGKPEEDGQPGDHVGLLIMQERARRIGGELRIESEPGEGTRIVLVLPPSTQEKRRILPMLRTS